MEILIKKLHPNAAIPFKGNNDKGNARYDLTATSLTISRNEAGELLYTYGLGFATAFSEEWEASIVPRSSVCKKALILSNSEGIIDSTYRGEWKVVFKLSAYHLDHHCVTDEQRAPYIYQVGDRVAQVAFRRVEPAEWKETDELPESLRGYGGFGSTGK